MGVIQSSINQALGVAAALAAPSKALKEQEERQAVLEESKRQKAIERESKRLDISSEAMDEADASLLKLQKPTKDLNMAEVQAYKANLQSGMSAYKASSEQGAESIKALYELTGDPIYAKSYAKQLASYGRNTSLANSIRESLNRRETDLLRGEEANKRAQEIQEAKKQLAQNVKQKRQSYLDQPLSIGGKEIGTVRGLPKDMRSQVKEGMKNGK